jgi:hypothetical protein
VDLLARAAMPVTAPIAQAPDPEPQAIADIIEAKRREGAKATATLIQSCDQWASALPPHLDTEALETINDALRKVVSQSVVDRVMQGAKSMDGVLKRVANPKTPPKQKLARVENNTTAAALLSGDWDSIPVTSKVEEQAIAWLKSHPTPEMIEIPTTVHELLQNVQQTSKVMDRRAIERAFTLLSKKLQAAAEQCLKTGEGEIACFFFDASNKLHASWREHFQPLAVACGYEAAADLHLNGAIRMAAGNANPASFLATLAEDAEARNALATILDKRTKEGGAGPSGTAQPEPKPGPTGGCSWCGKPGHASDMCYKAKKHYKELFAKEAAREGKKQYKKGGSE